MQFISISMINRPAANIFAARLVRHWPATSCYLLICYLLVYRAKFWNLHADNSIGWDILSPDISYNMFNRDNVETPLEDKSGLQIMRKKSLSAAKCWLSTDMMKFNPCLCRVIQSNHRGYSRKDPYSQRQILCCLKGRIKFTSDAWGTWITIASWKWGDGDVFRSWEGPGSG